MHSHSLISVAVARELNWLTAVCSRGRFFFHPREKVGRKTGAVSFELRRGMRHWRVARRVSVTFPCSPRTTRTTFWMAQINPSLHGSPQLQSAIFVHPRIRTGNVGLKLPSPFETTTHRSSICRCCGCFLLETTRLSCMSPRSIINIR